MHLTSDEKGILLLAARHSIARIFDDMPDFTIDYNRYPTLLVKAGAFVTLKKNLNLRGCIGYVTSELPLFETVCEAAVLASTEDYRFQPVSKYEISKLDIEISVLTPPNHYRTMSILRLGGMV